MKLSEMNTQELAKTLCQIAAPIERIGTSEDVNDAIKQISGDMNEGTVLSKLSTMIGQIMPALLGAHFEDTVAIIAAMTGKTAQQVREQNGMQTFRDVRSFLDEDFMRFFTSSAAQAREA